MHETRRFLTVEDMRDKLGGVGRSTIYRWEREGVIPKSYKMGSRPMWDENEVNRHIFSQREEQ